MHILMSVACDNLGNMNDLLLHHGHRYLHDLLYSLVHQALLLNYDWHVDDLLLWHLCWQSWREMVNRNRPCRFSWHWLWGCVCWCSIRRNWSTDGGHWSSIGWHWCWCTVGDRCNLYWSSV